MVSHDGLRLCFLVSVLISACAPQANVQPLGQAGDSCQYVADCGEGLQCLDGVCGVKGSGDVGSSCESDSYCGFGYICVAGLCALPAPPHDVVADTLGDVADLPDDTDAAGPVDVGGDATEPADVGEVDASPDITPVSPDSSDAGDGVVTDVPNPGDVSMDAGSPADANLDAFSPEVEGNDSVADSAVDVFEPEVDVAADVEAGPELMAEGEACDGNCQTGLACMPTGDLVNVCQPLPLGVCTPCESDADCPEEGAECLSFVGDKFFCGAPCLTSVGCPLGFKCEAEQCRPENGMCDCEEAPGGTFMGCENITGPEVACTGVMFCIDGLWSTCSAEPASQEVCDSFDNDCDGITDEEPLYSVNGVELGYGALCGIGQCAGGEVICTPDGGVTCSTNLFASTEICADNVDNDCDGIINEGCLSEDLDGDGVPNEDDCAPHDADTYAGALEPCCTANDPIEQCDQNCDGAKTLCAACDTDGDGFCAPVDCDDGDPTRHPLAAEVCDDGVDQDCQGGDLLCTPAMDLDGDSYAPPADCNDGNPSVFPFAQELCDNLDNDCDGVTDEGNPLGGNPCGTGADYCLSGVVVCTHYESGAILECQGDVLLGAELCDGLDNDCDGETDEDWSALGDVCDGPDSDLCDNGVTVCAEDKLHAICGAEELNSIPEICNGEDDDCDGAIDEFVCNVDDLDGDGWTIDEGDCNDHRADMYPGAQESCCDPDFAAMAAEICDKNCDLIVLPCSLFDGDADGFTAGQGDCDDEDDTVWPGAPEKCSDGVDQDCDDLDLACGTLEDKDNDGFVSTEDCNDNDEGVHPWAVEVCNYADDDCDGVVDDGNPVGLQGDCGPMTPECEPGVWVCVHDAMTYTVQELCVGPWFQEAELCNGLDDNCDGLTDESFFDLGAPCDGGDVDLCANGVFICGEDGNSVTCSAEEPADIQEICDASDNDCDGEIDEGLSWNDVALGEICDGVGECGLGVAMCSLAMVSTCSTNPDSPFTQAAPESCNGLDDDCDGVVDQTFAWEGSPVGGQCDGVGLCGAGIVECLDSEHATCSTNPDGSMSQATPELCNGLDDDCDGEVDEDVSVTPGACVSAGVCDITQAVVWCEDGGWACDFSAIPQWQADETLCDDLDNDCDGETDEFWGVGSLCDGPDTDLCAYGAATCAEDGMGVVCDNEIIVDLMETCNNVDDDCDGETDELSISPEDAGCLSQGVCEGSLAIQVGCAAAATICDYQEVEAYEAVETLCDGLDNDCDGATDEDFFLAGAPLGAACNGFGECGVGVVECHPGEMTPSCSTMPGASGDQSAVETCNGADDDCDGAIDEDFQFQGAVVNTPCQAAGICDTGVVECSVDGGNAVCSSGPGGSADASGVESCNGLDDDCDGETDEDVLGVVELSLCADQGVCADALVGSQCVGGALECVYIDLLFFEAAEVSCDGLDNDCDGETDAHEPLLGEPCDGSDADLCVNGVWVCAAGGAGIVCDEAGVGNEEVCDGLDNDCDGVADDGMAWDGIPLGQPCDGEGLCGVGLVVCGSGLNPTCSTNADGPQSQAQGEVCNGKDDDCDGATDEGLLWQGIGIGEACDGTGVCGAGVVICSPIDSDVTCSTNPDGSVPGGSVETCNGMDDDCDGATDESFPEAGTRCDAPDGGDGCATGWFQCAGGAVSCADDFPCPSGTQCVDPGAPALEICVCQGLPCDGSVADGCGPGGCTCAGGPACGSGTCQPGIGCL